MEIIKMKPGNLSSIHLLDLVESGDLSHRAVDAMMTLPINDKLNPDNYCGYLLTLQEFVNYTNRRGSLEKMPHIGQVTLKEIVAYMESIDLVFNTETCKWQSISIFELTCKSEVFYDFLIKLYPEVKLIDASKMKNIIYAILYMNETANDTDEDSVDEFKNEAVDKYTSEVEKMINDHGTTSVK